jgi:hypothetical protein
VFDFHNRPRRAAIDAERFRLFVERGVPRRDQCVCDVLNSDRAIAPTRAIGQPIFSGWMVGNDHRHSPIAVLVIGRMKNGSIFMIRLAGLHINPDAVIRSCRSAGSNLPGIVSSLQLSYRRRFSATRP